MSIQDLDPQLQPELEGADPAPHYVTDDELEKLLEHDHDERELDRRNVKPILTVAALGGVAVAAIALIVAIFAMAAGGDGKTTTVQAAAAAPAAVPAALAAAPTPAPAQGIQF